MADNFFHLTDQKTQDRVIKREQRIYADTMSITYNEQNRIETTSTAPYQKIKFFLDVVRLYDDTTDPITDRYYRVGRYFEVEPNEVPQHVFSQGFLWFTYECTQNDGNGGFDFRIIPSDPRYELFISSVVFEDSFYNPLGGWLNPDNPDNLLGVLQVEDLIGGKNLELAYHNLSMRNMDVTTHPISTYYQAYADDFVEIGWYKVAAASTQVFVFPKGVHRVKENINTPKPTFPYSGSGHYTIELPLASATIAYSAITVQQVNEPHDIKAKYATTATVGLDIPVDENGNGLIGFDFTTVVGANKGTIMWQAVDGQNYGIEFVGNTYAINAAFACDVSLIYLGRNPTGYSPVPEV